MSEQNLENKFDSNQIFPLSEVDNIFYLFFKIVIRRKRIFFLAAFLSLLIGASYTIYRRIFSPIYQGNFSLLISEPIRSNENSRTSSPMSQDFIAQLAINNINNDIPTLIEYLKSPLLLEEISAKYRIPLVNLQKSIFIDTPQSRFRFIPGVIEVKMIGKDKIFLTNALNDLSNIYLETSLNRRQKQLSDGLNFLQKQTPSLEKKTELIQNKLSKFRNKYRIVDPYIYAEKLRTKIDSINLQISNIKTDSLRLKKIKDSINNGSINIIETKETIGLENFNSGLSLSNSNQNLINKILQVNNQLADAKSKFTANSSIVKSLEKKLNELSPIFKENQIKIINNALKFNSTKLASLDLLKSDFEKEFDLQPDLLKEYESIKQQLEINSNNLKAISNAKERFELEISQKKLPWQLIAKTYIQDKPINPNLTKNFILTIFVSTVTGIGAALLLDKINNVYRTPEEISEYIKYPLLAHIRYIDSLKDINISNLDTDIINYVNTFERKEAEDKDSYLYNQFIYQETFRNLFTSIKFSSPGKNLKSLLISSSIPSEGKTLINLMLAKTMTDFGKKVLLIDSDMRKPQIHKRLNLDNILGLSNLLVDENLDYKNVIQKINNYQNLSIITSGTIPPDSTTLLNSPQMKKLVNQMKEEGNFDIIMFDSPPILGISDSVILGDYIDGIILVISVDNVKRILPIQAIKRMRLNNAQLLGVLSNEVNEKSLKRSDFSYNYNYSYSAYNPDTAYSYYRTNKNDAEFKEKSKLFNQKSKNKLIKRFQIFKNKFVEWIKD